MILDCANRKFSGYYCLVVWCNYNEIKIIYNTNVVDMKRNRKLLLIIFTTFSMLVLSGCVNMLQDINIREDGSGTLRFAFAVDSDVYPEFEARISEGLALENYLTGLMQHEDVTDMVQDHYEENGRTWDVIILEIADFSAVFAEERRIGPLEMVIREEDGAYTFEQTIDMVNTNITIPGINLLDISGAGYTVSLFTPQILDTNGVQPEGGLSFWDVPLDELIQQGDEVYLEADYVLDPYEGTFIPWELFFPYVVIGFLALGFIAILVVIIVNTTGRREKPQEYHF